MLYLADEVFFSGTAAEITSIRSIDRIVIGKGQPGPVTRKLQERFMGIVQGRSEDKYGWLTFCGQRSVPRGNCLRGTGTTFAPLL